MQVGIAADQHIGRRDGPFCGPYDRAFPVLQRDCTGAFEDLRAEPFGGRGFAQHKVEGMDMSAQAIDHAARIAVGPDIAANLLPGDHFKTAVAMLFPVPLVRLHFPELLLRERRKEASGNEVAVDIVGRHALADDLASLQRHGAERDRLLLAVT